MTPTMMFLALVCWDLFMHTASILLALFLERRATSFL